MQQQIYQVHYVDEQKQRLIDVWHRFHQCHQLRKWRKHLCVDSRVKDEILII